MKPLVLQLLSRFAKQGLAFLFGIVIVRYYGVTIYGSYGKIMVMANLCLGAITTAFTNNYMRSCSSAVFNSSLTGVLIATSIFLAIGGTGLGELFDVDTGSLMLGLLVVGLTGLSEIYVILSRVKRQDGLAIIIRTLPIVLSIISAVVFSKQSVLLLMSLIALSWLTVLFFLPIKELIREFDIYKVPNHFKPIVVLFITALSTQIYGNFDQLLIENSFDVEGLAIYRIAYTLASLAVPVIGVFSFLYITGLRNKLERKQLIRRFRNQICINVGFGLIILSCGFFVIEDLAYYLYRISHKDLRDIVTVHLIGVVLNSVGMVYSYSLLLIKKDIVILSVTVCAALISILLNMVLIADLGMIGAAYTSMITQLLILLAFMVYFHMKSDFFNVMST